MTRRTLEIAAFIAALLIAAMALHAWLTSRDEQARLSATLAAQTKILDAASSRESARQSALNDTLAQIDKLKRAPLTPEQILNALPQYLRLPEPLTMTPTGSSAAAELKKGTGAPQEPATSTTDTLPPPGSPSGLGRSSVGPPSAPSVTMSNLSPPTTRDLPTAPSAQIPTADLRPLYNYVQDCHAWQAQLAAARLDKADEETQIAALARQRDAAITASKGGTFLRRLRRNALWLVVGAGVGAAGAYASSRH